MLLRRFRYGCCKNIFKYLPRSQNVDNRQISTELTTALRPFYFAVHPDLFAQHPMQRRTNEDSLKQLNSHMEVLNERKYNVLHEGKTLQFYIRDSQASTRNTFKMIKITLDQRVRDPKLLIQRLLELCELSTEYIKSVKTTATPTPNSAEQLQRGYPTKGADYQYGSEFSGFEANFQQSKQDVRKTLDSWMAANADIAKTRIKELVGLKEEVSKLEKSLVAQLGLRDVRYDCGWNIEHYRGCLKTLERLANLHTAHMDKLKGRVVVFAPFTGVSLEGHIMLFTGDVLNNWFDFIRNIPKHDAFLKKIPIYENTLSQVLRKIKIGRRKFMPKQQAVEYAGHLTKVTTTLGDYLSRNKYPTSWPKVLDEFEIVIESESGPLMVNPTGQLIAPATCPGTILVDFITSNLDVAKERIAKYRKEKHIEKDLVERCIQELQLSSLTKDDSVTPDKMIETLKELLTHDASPFRGINLHITNYYSVLTDGIVCIPWDFKTR